VPLWRCPIDVARDAHGRDRLQLLAVPPQRRAVGLLRVRNGADRRPPRSDRGIHLGDKTLRTIHCRTCASVTHWEPLEPTPGAKHGVNLGNFDPALIACVRVRRFDGADTWKFIDE
jgi:hypothetical protein